MNSVRQALVKLDDAPDNPLNSSAKLLLLLSKHKGTQHSLEFTVLLIIDFIQSGALKPDQVSSRSLGGSGSGSSKKGPLLSGTPTLEIVSDFQKFAQHEHRADS